MNQADFIGRCQDLIDQGTKLLATKRPPPPNVVSDYSVDSGAFYEWKASGLSFVKMVFGDGHTHFRLFEGSVKHPYFNDALQGMGVLKAGYEELRGGFLGRVQDLVAAEIFTDFLEQAVHLLEAGYKDAAASVAGAVLEDGLRRIALGQKVAVKTNDDLSSLNHKLADRQVYTRLVQKVWNDTRNNAAHGKFEEYKVEDVSEMVKGIQGFLADHL
jgi:hypothetical protein